MDTVLVERLPIFRTVILQLSLPPTMVLIDKILETQSTLDAVGWRVRMAVWRVQLSAEDSYCALVGHGSILVQAALSDGGPG